MAWVTTKDGRQVNTDWFDKDKEDKKREHTPLSEQRKRKEFDDKHRALTKHQKINAEWEEHKRRSEQGIKTKYGTPNHSKLHQHSEIQKMADDHVEKIWTKEGGVMNKELYDEADKFAEKHGLDKKKVRDAAMKAMNEKEIEASRLNREGKDPLQGVKERREKANKKEVSLDKIKSYGYDPADATGDPTVINADGESYYKVGENKWKRHASSGRVLSDSISDEKLAETLASAKDVKVMPSQKKNAKSLTAQMKEANNEKQKSSIDLSMEGTRKLNGQEAPKDLPRVSDNEALKNKVVDYNGQKYTIQPQVEWNEEEGEHIVGNTYVPTAEVSRDAWTSSGKGSFFVSKDGKMYHDGSQYLQERRNQKKESAKKSLTEEMKEANDKHNTPEYKQKVNEIKDYMEQHPSQGLKEATDHYHYMHPDEEDKRKNHQFKKKDNITTKRQERIEHLEQDIDDMYSKYSQQFSADPNQWLMYGAAGKDAYYKYKEAVEEYEPNARKRSKYFKDRRKF